MKRSREKDRNEPEILRLGRAESSPSGACLHSLPLSPEEEDGESLGSQKVREWRKESAG